MAKSTKPQMYVYRILQNMTVLSEDRRTYLAKEVIERETPFLLEEEKVKAGLIEIISRPESQSVPVEE